MGYRVPKSLTVRVGLRLELRLKARFNIECPGT